MATTEGGSSHPWASSFSMEQDAGPLLRMRDWVIGSRLRVQLGKVPLVAPHKATSLILVFITKVFIAVGR